MQNKYQIKNKNQSENSKMQLDVDVSPPAYTV